jgi:hypothetical protein
MKKNALREASTCPLCHRPKTRGQEVCHKCYAEIVQYGNTFATLEIERARELAQMEMERM